MRTDDSIKKRYLDETENKNWNMLKYSPHVSPFSSESTIKQRDNAASS